MGWEDDDETQTNLRLRLTKKAFDLQKQLLNHFLKKNELSDVDVVRYTAMVEVLEAMLA